MVSLRVLTTDDRLLWRALRLAALTDTSNAFKVRRADWDRDEEERWHARLELSGAYPVAALLDGHAVGMASGLPRAADIRESRSAWGSSQARGRGIGDRLITAVETWALGPGGAALRGPNKGIERGGG
ncbi:GNAT family N-acetyltransferase [Streptomyces sp. NPDC021356]|uniref:GNAT family N-acetyltransferase n=1 Tax=Streptomyces sp. NPDC021356 TaxID=3154900 RepID=UPI0033ED834B